MTRQGLGQIITLMRGRGSTIVSPPSSTYREGTYGFEVNHITLSKYICNITSVYLTVCLKKLKSQKRNEKTERNKQETIHLC